MTPYEKEARVYPGLFCFDPLTYRLVSQDHINREGEQSIGWVTIVVVRLRGRVVVISKLRTNP
ncbi:MAG: hypothetical protein RL179_433, partial [Planctomycetota bacterium]